MLDIDTYFLFEGRKIALSVSPHWRIQPPGETKERWLFHLYINKYYLGCITKTPDGVWRPHFNFNNPYNPNCVLVLYGDDLDIIGEMIEREMPDYV